MATTIPLSDTAKNRILVWRSEVADALVVVDDDGADLSSTATTSSLSQGHRSVEHQVPSTSDTSKRRIWHRIAQRLSVRRRRRIGASPLSDDDPDYHHLSPTQQQQQQQQQQHHEPNVFRTDMYRYTPALPHKTPELLVQDSCDLVRPGLNRDTQDRLERAARLLVQQAAGGGGGAKGASAA